LTVVKTSQRTILITKQQHATISKAYKTDYICAKGHNSITLLRRK